jgi:hypothetical protein
MNAMQSTQILMFVDVVGSAHIYQRMSDSEASQAIDRCLKRVQRAIESGGGRIVQSVGDEVLAVFGGAEEACAAAIEAQQRVADLPPVSGVRLQIRIALHHGDFAQAGDNLEGEAITTAARMAGLAKGEQILCSENVSQALGDLSLYRPRASSMLEQRRGHPSLPPLQQLDWLSLPASATTEPQQAEPLLRIHYRGQTYVVDTVSPHLTIGREPGNTIQINDRKASRQHARIEKRPDGFYLVDTSTNGSFVYFKGKQENMIRRYEIHLADSGSICLGCSRNDPNADCLIFEQT